MPRSCRRFASILSALLISSTPVRSGADWITDGSPVGWDCSGQAEYLSAIPDLAGGVHFLWSYNGDHVRRVDANGNLYPGWTSCGPQLSSESTGLFLQYDHAECPDGAGGLFVLFRMIVGCNDHCSGDPKALYLQHVGADMAIAPGWPSSGVVVASSATGNDHLDPAIAPDGHGGVVVAWTERPFASSNRDVMAQRVAGDASLLWSAGGVPVCTAAGTQQRPAIIATAAGGALIFWEDARPTATVSDLFMRAIGADGHPDGNPDGMPLCAAAGAQTFPMVLADGAGGTFVLWIDARNGSGAQVFGQHVNASLAPQWSAGGVSFSGPGGDFVAPPISDGSGGFFLAWSDRRNAIASGIDVFAGRFTSGGTPTLGWPASGIPLCTSPGDQFNPWITSDGMGGFFVAWADQRSGQTHLYATRRHADGAPAAGWGTDGTAVCTVAGGQYPLSAVSSWPGSAIVLWADARMGSREIAYATRLVNDGPVPALVSLVSVRTTSSSVDFIWECSGGDLGPMTVERSDGSAWLPRGTLTADGSGRTLWRDDAVEPGGHYGYRLVWGDAEGLHRSSETWLDIPSIGPLGIRGIRVMGSAVAVDCEAPSPKELMLALFDVTGRRCATTRVVPHGAGRAVGTLLLSGPAVSGIYLVIAEQAGMRAARSFAIVR